jgi:hypothetical protein
MEMQLKTTSQSFQWAHGSFPRRMLILAQGKKTTDYLFAIDLTGKNCLLMNFRKEIH